MSDRHGNGTQQFEATMPTCPPWCVDCWDLSDDLPGSRFHHGEPTPLIPARVEIAGVDNYIQSPAPASAMYCRSCAGPAFRMTPPASIYVLANGTWRLPWRPPMPGGLQKQS